MDKAEFDRFADEYRAQHAASIAASGEAPEFFASYKVADVLREIRRRRVQVGRILDFGSGVGNSLPFFRKHFPQAELTCADVSARSLEISQMRFPDAQARFAEISGNTLPLPDGSVDISFAACVFHHIPPEEHVYWLSELRRVTRPSGLLFVFEHNPLNFLTVSAVRNCPFDENAELIRAGTLRRRAHAAGWVDGDIAFRIFFPRALAFARPLERFMSRIPLAAQYYLVAQRP